MFKCSMSAALVKYSEIIWFSMRLYGSQLWIWLCGWQSQIQKYVNGLHGPGDEVELLGLFCPGWYLRLTSLPPSLQHCFVVWFLCCRNNHIWWRGYDHCGDNLYPSNWWCRRCRTCRAINTKTKDSTREASVCSSWCHSAKEVEISEQAQKDSIREEDEEAHEARKICA